MATPIKDTPILRGKVARRFEALINESETKKVSIEERERIMSAGRNVRIFNSMAEYECFRADSTLTE